MSAELDDTQASVEAVGIDFNKNNMLIMRGKTRQVIHEIAANVKPGMVQEDAVDMARDIMARKDMVRGWHETLVRFGSNTLKTLGADSDPGVVLKENDIFFIDIGPVCDEWEGDGGATFVVGNNPEMKKCADDAQKLFHIVRQKWQRTGLTGGELYEFATAEALAMGWELNRDWSGHRLSDFPHSAVYNGTMAEVGFKPSPLLWVLEIHIRSRAAGFGAFFEDMLLDDSYFL
jgi:Xaa-Pro aminopeptidase